MPDEAAFSRGEEENGGGDFFRFTGAAQRGQGGVLRFEVCDLLLAESQFARIAFGDDLSG